MILSLRTDKPEAEIGLFTESGEQVAYHKWQAHRELSSTILAKIEEILSSNTLSQKDITGIVFYKGPGSFTGLRIGASVANAFAYSLGMPSIGETDDDWIKNGTQKLKNGQSEMLIPEYGAPPHITEQKK